MDIETILFALSCVFVTVLAQYPELEEVEQKECRKRNLEYGQSYYIFRDNRHDSNATDVLKGSGKIYKGKIHTYVEFFIVAPNVYHGVAVKKVCMFTCNVISIDLTINKEAQPDVFGEPDHVLSMSEYVQHSKYDHDKKPKPRSKKTCFILDSHGDIASIIIKLNRGNKRRIRLARLSMEACEGEHYNFL